MVPGLEVCIIVRGAVEFVVALDGHQPCRFVVVKMHDAPLALMFDQGPSNLDLDDVLAIPQRNHVDHGAVIDALGHMNTLVVLWIDDMVDAQMLQQLVMIIG